MCGIVGILNRDDEPVSGDLLHRMTMTLRHRGPDDEGVRLDGPVGLGMRRLAIIDLSPRANQPLSNEDGGLWLVFNGEIYNFQSLRDELMAVGHTFRSEGDAETVVHLYEQLGVNCLHRLRGMFAFALWDTRTRTLLLARDRLGKKPLFYYSGARVFAFASEPKAILQHPQVQAEADPEAIHHYLTFGFVPSPWSAFRGIRKLPPGHYLTVNRGEIAVRRYWQLRYGPKRTESESTLAEELDATLAEAVRLRLISDVPLGALLSGGIDSSAVVAVMRRFMSGPLRTFSVGFDDSAYDELAYARMVARRFETEHHEIVVKPQALDLLPRLVWHYNEPFADSSAIPSLALCGTARQLVTVALSGDGGDESFLGYDRYLAARLASGAGRLPVAMRRTVARAARWAAGYSTKATLHRLGRFAEALALAPRARYGHWTSIFPESMKGDLYTEDFGRQVGPFPSSRLLEAAYEATDASTFAEASAHADVQLYLPDDLLVKMDIASMAHALEVRSPLLDHQVVEFAARLPARLKLHGLTQKYLLKRIMANVLPPAIVTRRKMGFGVPLDRWFRHELRSVAYDVLLDSAARARGYFQPEIVRRLLDEHTAVQAQHQYRLWALLVLELWHRMFIDRPCPVTAPTACA